MQKYNRLGAALAALVLACPAAGVAQDATATEPQTDSTAAEAAPDAKPIENVGADTVVATVNGTDITLGHMLVLKQRLPEQYQQIPPAALFEGILDQLVQQTVLGQKVETLSKGAQFSLDNEGRALRAAQEIQGVADAAVTDEAIQKAYDAAFTNAAPENEWNASHILVATEDEAKALVEELKGGADFAKLATEKSSDTSGPGGGSLGWFGKGMMVEPFETAVAGMKVGDVSDPVQTQFGWHVIKLNETRIKEAPPLDEVKGALADQVGREAVEAHVADLMKTADVTRKSAAEIGADNLTNYELLVK